MQRDTAREACRPTHREREAHERPCVCLGFGASSRVGDRVYHRSENSTTDARCQEVIFHDAAGEGNRLSVVLSELADAEVSGVQRPAIHLSMI